MANRNRYQRDNQQRDNQRDSQNASQGDFGRGQGFGGTRRGQNFNEYGGNREFYGGSRTYAPGPNEREGSDFNRGRNYGQDLSSRILGQHFGGGSRGNFGGRSGDDREGRHDVGRDFLTNQPIRESYGEMSDSRFGQQFGRRSSGDYGRGFSYSEPNYSEPSRDFTERGGYSGATYGGYGANWVDRDDETNRGRTDFDESIAGRSYFGSGNRGYERPGWRAYGSRPGNLDFGDRERPDSWERDAYRGSERGSFGRLHEPDFEHTNYASTQYGEGSWRNRDRGDYTGAGYYRNDYERGRRNFDQDDSNLYNRLSDNDVTGETFGDKVKSFFGIGPKGYRRSDERIREDISERLEDHPRIDASNIEVQVADGEVTLTGTTPDRASKRLAEDVAEQCRGVKDVHNQVRLNQSGIESTASSSSRTSSASGSATAMGGQSGSTPASVGGTGSTTPTTTKKGNERAA